MLLYCTDVNTVTEEQYEVFLSVLDEERKAKAQRYRRFEDRVLSALSYVLLRYALHLNGDNEKYSVIYNEYGKPFFENSSTFFNISHTDGAVACALGDVPVGVDIQKKVSNYTLVMHRVCTEKEKISVITADDPPLEFTTIWTLKESILKCIGTGIAGSMTKYDFSENKTENGKYKLITLYDGNIVLSACTEKSFLNIKKIHVSELYEFCKEK